MAQRDVILVIAAVVVLPLVNLFGFRMWVGATDQHRMFGLSRSWLFWSGTGLGSVLVLIWLAMSLDLLVVGVLLVRVGYEKVGQLVGWLAIPPLVLWVTLALSGHPHVALPPWFRRGRPPVAGEDSSSAHRVTINYVAEVARGTAPYFIPLCACGDVGEAVPVARSLSLAREACIANARGHSAHIDPQIAAPLDPMPRFD